MVEQPLDLFSHCLGDVEGEAEALLAAGSLHVLQEATFHSKLSHHYGEITVFFYFFDRQTHQNVGAIMSSRKITIAGIYKPFPVIFVVYGNVIS